jgi:hypothetical protein
MYVLNTKRTTSLSPPTLSRTRSPLLQQELGHPFVELAIGTPCLDTMVTVYHRNQYILMPLKSVLHKPVGEHSKSESANFGLGEHV